MLPDVKWHECPADDCLSDLREAEKEFGLLDEKSKKFQCLKEIKVFGRRAFAALCIDNFWFNGDRVIRIYIIDGDRALYAGRYVDGRTRPNSKMFNYYVRALSLEAKDKLKNAA